MLVVQVQLMDHRLQHALGVIGIVDREVGRVADLGGLPAQDAGEDRVEGADVEVARVAAPKDVLHPLFHLLGGLVGEGQGQYVEGIHPVGHQVGDAVGEDLCFPAPCPGHDHQGSVHMGHCFTLPFIQPCQVILHPANVTFPTVPPLSKSRLSKSRLLESG